MKIRKLFNSLLLVNSHDIRNFNFFSFFVQLELVRTEAECDREAYEKEQNSLQEQLEALTQKVATA